MNYNENEVYMADQVRIESFLPKVGLKHVQKEIITGLTSVNKYISSKYFYDKQGSELFEEITSLDEYYPTRTEKSILKNIAPQLMKDFKNRDIIELGSGDHSKIKIILDEVPEKDLSDLKYIPIDVSRSAILDASSELSDQYSDLEIEGMVLDFTKQLHLIPHNRNRLFCFLGSTIGNFNYIESIDLLKNISDSMQAGDKFLLGLDLVKPESVLHAAYNDEKGVTADFNKNILLVVNRLLQTNFDPADFKHKAFWNKDKSRIEMHLQAEKEQKIESPHFKSPLLVKKGESIHTENSQKYSLSEISHLAKQAQLKIKKVHTDKKVWFALAELSKN